MPEMRLIKLAVTEKSKICIEFNVGKIKVKKNVKGI